MKLCECGCGLAAPIATKNNTARGRVKGQPQRFVKNHHLWLSPVEYIVDDVTGCWLWQRARNLNGYGHVNAGGRSCNAHRFVYERERGPIEVGLVLDHLCRNRICVNPDHMEPVTFAENARRGRAAVLTQELADEIRESMEGRRDLALKYGVSVWTIDGIRAGRRWRVAS